MSDYTNKIINERLSDYEGQMFLIHNHSNRQDINDLTREVTDIIAKHELSATVTKGFLEYMKLVIDDSSYLPQKK